MTDYADAAHEAYRRLKWAEQNRPSSEELERIRKEGEQETRRAKINRLRSRVA